MGCRNISILCIWLMYGVFFILLKEILHSISPISYSRIDYFFISHPLLRLQRIPKIGMQFRIESDCHLLFLPLQIPNTRKPISSWRLNESLFRDEMVLKFICEAIKDFQRNHVFDLTPWPIKWKALKCVICGKSIQLGTRLKKKRDLYEYLYYWIRFMN